MLSDRFSFRGYAREALAAARRVTSRHAKRDQGTVFVIFGRGRCGTTLLVELLNGFRDVHCDGEVFHYPVLFPARLLQNLRLTNKAPYYGVKLLSYQLLEIQSRASQIMPATLAALGYRVLYVTRNHFYQSVSVLRARQLGVWHERKRAERQPIFHISLSELAAQLERNRFLDVIESQMLSGIPYDHISYEHDLASPEGQTALLKLLGDKFGERGVGDGPKLKKLVSGPVLGAIANPKEVWDYLQGHRITSLLDARDVAWAKQHGFTYCAPAL
jgi:LPS sulfotransferase NodH